MKINLRVSTANISGCRRTLQIARDLASGSAEPEIPSRGACGPLSLRHCLPRRNWCPPQLINRRGYARHPWFTAWKMNVPGCGNRVHPPKLGVGNSIRCLSRRTQDWSHRGCKIRNIGGKQCLRCSVSKIAIVSLAVGIDMRVVSMGSISTCHPGY